MLKTENMMTLPVPMHNIEPTDQPIIRYVQPAELNNVLRDLILKEQETTCEQVLVVRLHSCSDGSWQPHLYWYKPREDLPETGVPGPVLEIGQAEPVTISAASASRPRGGEAR